MEIVVAEWETATGFSPWMEDASADDHLYTANGTGGISLRSAMTDIDSVSIDGSVLDASLWTAVPAGAGRFTGIHFEGLVASGFQAITVTGKRGWGQIPEDVWVAVFKRAVEYAASSGTVTTTGAAKGNVKREKVGSVEIEYDPAASASSFDSALVARYRRMF